MSQRRPEPSAASALRAAVYCRKSVEEGLQQDFNSLDNQFERGTAYVASQGWTLAGRYEDGGYSGATTDRPAFQRLRADVLAKKVDVIVAYKLDRLSRNTRDFILFLEFLKEQGVAIALVTQQVDTTTAAGRAMLNLLMVFAELERDQTAERTRDKVRAARLKGLFVGGRPILGYDLVRAPGGSRLVVNPAEADQVKQIFAWYLEHGALLPTLQEVQRKGWRNKAWTSRKDKPLGGAPFDKTALHRLLKNPTYCGKLRNDGVLIPGQHEPIVAEKAWEKVQATLERNGRRGGADRNRNHALLKGLLTCGPCGCPMGFTYTVKRGRRYTYYTCVGAMKKGWATCPVKSVPAGEVERFIAAQVAGVGADPKVLAETLKAVRAQEDAQVAERAEAARSAARELAKWRKGAAPAPDAVLAAETRRAAARRRRDALAAHRAAAAEVGAAEVGAALADFPALWETFTPRERHRLVHLLLERVVYDGEQLALTFRPNGLAALAKRTAESAP